MKKRPQGERPIETMQEETRDTSADNILLERLRQIQKEKFEIRPLRVKSLEGIAETEGVSLDQLEEALKKRFAGFVKELNVTCSPSLMIDESAFSHVDLIHDLYQHSFRDESREQLPWLVSLHEADSFIQQFLPEIKARGVLMLKSMVMEYVRVYVHHPRIAELRIEDSRFKKWKGKDIFRNDGDWVALPDTWSSDWGEPVRKVVDRSVVQEIVELLEIQYQRPDYTHATGSAALLGVGGEGALLSSYDAKERGVSVITGEHGQSQRWRDEESALNVHGSVYVDRGGPRFGYNTIRWFNEFFVTFGISEERQLAHLASLKEERGEAKEEFFDPYSIRDMGGEGILIGESVPLQNVDVVYAWKDRLEDLQEWVDEHCPHVSVVSLEAVDVMTSHGGAINRLAIEQGIDPVEAWKLLLEMR